MSDLTVIMLTPNKVPKSWARYHKKKLLEAIGGADLITMSKVPMNWGRNFIQAGYGITNLYRELLRGAQHSRSKYIAVADDDTLYPKEHFAYRPPEGTFAYNMNRWHLFTWGTPYYFYKPRPGNGLMIADRRLLVSALIRRFRKEPELRGSFAKEFGVDPGIKRYDGGKVHEFYTETPVVSFYHEESIDPLNKSHRKYPWPVRAFDLPGWGHAAKLRKKFK